MCVCKLVCYLVCACGNALGIDYMVVCISNKVEVLSGHYVAYHNVVDYLAQHTFCIDRWHRFVHANKIMLDICVYSKMVVRVYCVNVEVVGQSTTPLACSALVGQPTTPLVCSAHRCS